MSNIKLEGEELNLVHILYLDDHPAKVFPSWQDLDYHAGLILKHVNVKRNLIGVTYIKGIIVGDLIVKHRENFLHD